MLKHLSADEKYRVFLSLLSLIGLAFVFIATSKYGAGVSSDAARNLSTADSLIAGKGFVDMLGGPFVLWPPLYPLIIAGISLATSLHTFVAAWYLNILLYGINIWLAGWWLYLIFRDQPAYAAIGSIVFLFSRSMLRIHANVASEPLFESLLLLFLLAAASYLRAGDAGTLWSMCLTAGLASLQRYLGVVLLGVAILVILRREGIRGILRGAVPWLVACLPIVAWVTLHNMPNGGTLFGPRELGDMLPLQNISLALTKMLWWFVPRWGPLDWLVLRPWVPLVVGTGLLSLLSRRHHWRSWLEPVAGELVWPALAFGFVYCILVAFTVVTADHLDLTSDRYYVILLPIVLVVLLITLERLVLNRLRSRKRLHRLAPAILIVLWFAYPAFAVFSYLQDAVARGEPTNYNIANSAQFREMRVVKAAESILQSDPGAVVYSNYVNIVWFIFGHPVAVLPFEDSSLSRDQRLTALERNYPEWPATPGYIIWFTPNQYHHIVAPDELETIADLHLLFDDKTGQVYRVEPLVH